MPKYLMKCGHANQGHDSAGNPVCVICAGFNDGATEVDHEIEDVREGLDGRTAKCSYCSTTEESRWDLAFFKYQPDKDMDDYYCGCRGWD